MSGASLVEMPQGAASVLCHGSGIRYRAAVRRFDWAITLRVLALLVTAFFFAAAVLQAVLAFDVLGAAPPDQDDFIEQTIDLFTWEQSRWPVEFAATALFALGFLSLGGLGVLLSRLASTADPRRMLTTSAFLGAAGIGAASQLMWLGVKPIATSPQYCECGLRAEEIMSRLMILGVASVVQVWLVIGALLLLAFGTVLLAGIGREHGMSSRWVWLSLVIAALSVVVGVLSVLSLYPVDQLVLLVTAGILTPIWALWLATCAEMLVPPEAKAPPA
jgi:hypothetical protein